MYKTFDVNLPLKNILIFGRGANILVLPKALFPTTHRKLKSTLGQFEKQVNFFFIKAPFCFLVKSVYMKFIFLLTKKGLVKAWNDQRGEVGSCEQDTCILFWLHLVGFTELVFSVAILAVPSQRQTNVLSRNKRMHKIMSCNTFAC